MELVALILRGVCSDNSFPASVQDPTKARLASVKTYWKLHFLRRRAEKLLSSSHYLHESSMILRCLLRMDSMRQTALWILTFRHRGGAAQWVLPSSKDSTPESQVDAASFSCRRLMISCSSEPELFSSAAFCTITWL